jgi:hypothetical protein
MSRDTNPWGISSYTKAREEENNQTKKKYSRTALIYENDKGKYNIFKWRQVDLLTCYTF